MTKIELLIEQENLHQQKFGCQPVQKLTETTEFHVIPLFLFWRIFQFYGDNNSFTSKKYGPYEGIMFNLDPTKTQGIEGCFICRKTGKENLSYSLSYFASTDPDFSETSPVHYFPMLEIAAGYCSSSGVDWQGYAWEKIQLEPGKYKTSINIRGPKIESNTWFNNMKTEMFLIKILQEEYFPLKDWVQFKTDEVAQLPRH